MTDRLVSDHFPYLPLSIQIREYKADVEALVDTGFEGDVLVPLGFFVIGGPSDFDYNVLLADDTARRFDGYYGRVQVGNLGRFSARVAVGGSEFLVGRRIMDRFRLIFDHGQQPIVEP